jgi:hypothetical protein
MTSSLFALPDAQIVIPRYAAVTAPTTNANPVLAKPVAVRSGNVNGALSLQVQLETIDAQADLYIGISAPEKQASAYTSRVYYIFF